MVLDGDVHLRFRGYEDEKGWLSDLVKHAPEKLDCGALYSARVTQEPRTLASRELVFDVDLDAYDDLRKLLCGCQGKSICDDCYAIAAGAMEVMKLFLRDAFGYRHMFVMYSGRRGLHLWVVDEDACALSAKARKTLLDFVGCHKPAKPFGRIPDPVLYWFPESLCRYGYSMQWDDALRILEPLFLKVCVQRGKLLDKPGLWERLLSGFSEPAQKKLSVTFQLTSGEAKWVELRRGMDAAVLADPTQSAQILGPYMRLVFSCLWPRCDLGVTTELSHLSKMPFSVSPDTGRLSVPIPDSALADFRPSQCPTLALLFAEMNTVAPSPAPASASAAASAAAPAVPLQPKKKKNHSDLLAPYVSYLSLFVASAWPAKKANTLEF